MKLAKVIKTPQGTTFGRALHERELPEKSNVQKIEMTRLYQSKTGTLQAKKQANVTLTCLKTRYTRFENVEAAWNNK